MTLPKIEEARRTLQELKTDEVELSRLLADQTAGIQAVKDGGSRDFALLASLEAKRAALATMLTEQRTSMARAKTELSGLEAEQKKTEQLADLRARVSSLQARKQETDNLLIELGAFLTAHLAMVTAARVACSGELQAAVATARNAFGIGYLEEGGHNNDRVRAEWSRAFSEIGPGSAEALSLLPSSKHTRGLQRPYSRPDARQGHAGDIAIYTASNPLLWYLDRPVSLTIAEAIEAADHALPEEFRGNERVW